jgi:hypothetical protein
LRFLSPKSLGWYLHTTYQLNGISKMCINKNATSLTAELARQLFDYCPSTGVIKWRVDIGTKIRAGEEAGSINTLGYRYIYLKHRAYLAHRLAWLITFGELPKGVIDHINHDRADNRIANLRDVSPSTNLMNRKSIRKGSGSQYICQGIAYEPGKRPETPPYKVYHGTFGSQFRYRVATFEDAQMLKALLVNGMTPPPAGHWAPSSLSRS